MQVEVKPPWGLWAGWRLIFCTWEKRQERGSVPGCPAENAPPSMQPATWLGLEGQAPQGQQQWVVLSPGLKQRAR